MNYRLELFSILLQFLIVKLYRSFTAPPTKKEANCTLKPVRTNSHRKFSGFIGYTEPTRKERTAILSGKAQSRVRSHAPSIQSHRGTKVVWPDFQPMRVPEEPVCIDIFRQNPVFTSLHLKSPVHVHRLSYSTLLCRVYKKVIIIN